ncbi:hypothetical protein FRC09_016655 [Ceratobasidium sp. 395]|nr:hypothetical protein FRC09_016655 [Ceratobasidium sp. 395]
MPYISRIPAERRVGDNVTAWTGREVELCWLNEPRGRGNTSDAKFVIEVPRPKRKYRRLGFRVKPLYTAEPNPSSSSSAQQFEHSAAGSELTGISETHHFNSPSYADTLSSIDALPPITPEVMGEIMTQIASLEAADAFALHSHRPVDHDAGFKPTTLSPESRQGDHGKSIEEEDTEIDVVN